MGATGAGMEPQEFKGCRHAYKSWVADCLAGLPEIVGLIMVGVGPALASLPTLLTHRAPRGRRGARPGIPAQAPGGSSSTSSSWMPAGPQDGGREHRRRAAGVQGLPARLRPTRRQRGRLRERASGGAKVGVGIGEHVRGRRPRSARTCTLTARGRTWHCSLTWVTMWWALWSMARRATMSPAQCEGAAVRPHRGGGQRGRLRGVG